MTRVMEVPWKLRPPLAARLAASRGGALSSPLTNSVTFEAMRRAINSGKIPELVQRGYAAIAAGAAAYPSMRMKFSERCST
jgi:hypothetical protein